MPRTHDLDGWTFDPAAQELRNGEARVRLEHRASRALELLCERRGEVVSQADLLQRLWGGRQVSDNSLAVVIGDLRRALGDSARQPRFVETVAKSGYRLIAPLAAAPTPAPPPGRRLALAGGMGFILLAAWGGYQAWPRPGLLLVTPVENATGDRTYDGLAEACSGLILSRLGGEAGLRLRKATPDASLPAGAARLTVKLTLWTGLPYLVLTVEDGRSVLWTGSVLGREPDLPAKIGKELADLTRSLRAQPARTKP